MSNKTKKPAAKPDGNAVGAMRSWVLIATVVALFFAFYKANPSEPATHELTQTEFYKALEEGKIIEPVIRFIDRDEGATYLTGEMETDKVDKEGKPLADKNGDPVRVNYRVPLVPGENESLMEDLFRQQIQVKVRERRSPLSPLVMNILFFGAMMFLFYWFFYRKMGSGDGVFGFGKSRAKLLDGKAEGGLEVLIPAANDKAYAEIERQVGDNPPPASCHVEILRGKARDVLRQADCAAVASGTATLEAALARCPTVLVYAVSPLLAWFARRVIKGVRHIGLANVIAEKTDTPPPMPELLQEAFTPEAVADQLSAWLVDADAREKAIVALDATMGRLKSDGDAIGNAAREVLSCV